MLYNLTSRLKRSGRRIRVGGLGLMWLCRHHRFGQRFAGGRRGAEQP